MSKLLINQYYQNLDRTLQFGKSRNEQSIRNHFWWLLNEYARKYNYEVVPEVSCMGTRGVKVRPDGVVKNLWGLDIGLWESKDEKDDIETEIDSKIKKGYPLTNILFEDSNTAVLFQRGAEVERVPVRDAERLDKLINEFLDFKSETVYKFEEAIEKFKADIPTIVETLRDRIDLAQDKNKDFLRVLNDFFELCKAEINPDITLADIREMMIQHILTSDIFNRIFDDPDFHHHNTIAAELEKLVNVLFNYAERRNLLNAIEHYYEAINATAAGITDHHEKQKFLKVLYENFYKVYNPKAADRLGVVYTPNEIVQFMVRSTDYLLHKHFGKTLADKNVEILDPATGTGTFICEIIENAIPKHQLDYKYKNEIHCNEVAILPYYIANLNIEYTFKQKMGYYAEFPNSCFVDTLDNTDALAHEGKQQSIFALSSENSERIKRQNSKKISVIIGNPPYNAKQALYNDLNSNRQYNYIDRRIKETYIKHGTAQNQIVVYDMYTRFYRWASDRLNENGVLALITNRSFIDGRAFDGFRKSIQDDFDFAYIIDTKSDVRTNPKIAGTTHNVFGIQTGVAVMILIKRVKKENNQCQIKYISFDDFLLKEQKLQWFTEHQIKDIPFDNIIPDKKNNWINQSDNDFDDLIPLIDKDVKAGKSENALFKLFSSGIKTQRDEWVYDHTPELLESKVKFMVDIYQKTIDNPGFSNKMKIKWDRELTKYLESKISKSFNKDKVVKSLYRPYFPQYFYFDKHFNGMTYLWFEIYNPKNQYLVIPGLSSPKDFHVLTSKEIVDLNCLPAGSQCLPIYRFDKTGNKLENITDWGLSQFQNHYGNTKINKESIFHYVYGVLHNPAYKAKYELNLKRDFPRIPFYKDFEKWSKWGKQIMEIHIGFETIEPFNLKEINLADVDKPKAKLKAIKEAGEIVLDDGTTLKGIPNEAWEYKLGNRSALEWVLDQYKEKKPSDPTIAEKFNTYRFADYKTKVIDLLKRVCTVSVETMKIVREMEREDKS